MRNARLCRLLAGQGFDVVCATISLFHEVQRWNRENIPNYREIYLRVPIDGYDVGIARVFTRGIADSL